MKKPIVLIAAIVAVVGLGTAVALGKETTKVRTSVSIQHAGNRETGTFSGKVRAKAGCQKQRKVVLAEAEGGGLFPIPPRHPDADTSNKRGRYRIGHHDLD